MACITKAVLSKFSLLTETRFDRVRPARLERAARLELLTRRWYAPEDGVVVERAGLASRLVMLVRLARGVTFGVRCTFVPTLEAAAVLVLVEMAL